MTEQKLRRCPFCGNEPTIVIRKGKDGWRDRYSVLCDYEHGGCGAESGWYHYEAEAVESWNRRVPPTTKQIEEYIEKTHKENTELVAKLKRKCDVKKMTCQKCGDDSINEKTILYVLKKTNCEHDRNDVYGRK